MFFNSSGKYKAYALVTAPKFVVDRILPLNGIIFNSRNLSMEINKSTTPYDRAAMQIGSSRQSHFPTSGNKNAKGEPRPVPNAASRQEESVSSINRIEDESGGTNPEGAGGDPIPHKTTNPWHKFSVSNRTDDYWRKQMPTAH